LEVLIHGESMKSSDNKNTDNNKLSHNDEDLKHKRRLLLEILKQRKVFTESETGKLINDDTDIRTLLNILQKEKGKDTMKTKELPEAFFHTDKLAGIKTMPYYTVPYNLWYLGYCSARDLICQLTMTWLLLLAMNPSTGWFFHPFVFGWTQ
jgi:hypothetical protein